MLFLSIFSDIEILKIFLNVGTVDLIDIIEGVFVQSSIIRQFNFYQMQK